MSVGGLGPPLDYIRVVHAIISLISSFLEFLRCLTAKPASNPVTNCFVLFVLTADRPRDRSVSGLLASSFFCFSGFSCSCEVHVCEIVQASAPKRIIFRSITKQCEIDASGISG